MGIDMNKNTQKRIDAYLAMEQGAHFIDEFRDTQEFADIVETAKGVVAGNTYRVNDDTYTKDDCITGLSEYGISDKYDVYMGDLLECVEHDPMQAKTLLKKMMLDRAIDEVYEMGLWE